MNCYEDFNECATDKTFEVYSEIKNCDMYEEYVKQYDDSQSQCPGYIKEYLQKLNDYKKEKFQIIVRF